MAAVKDLKLVQKKARRTFFWRLFGLMVVALFLILDLYFIIKSSDQLPYNISLATDRLSFYYAFFTTQTNYMVLIYLFALLLEHKVKKNNTPTNKIIFLAITVYITITMLVFWVGLFTIKGERNQYSDPYNLVKTIIMHLIMPIVMISCFFLTSGNEKYNLKEHHKLYLWFILFYPAFYLVYIMIRGNLRWNENYGEQSYPYPFLNYHQNGIGFLILAIIAILILAIGLQYFYMWINNFRYKKKHHRDNYQTPKSKITYTYNMNRKL